MDKGRVSIGMDRVQANFLHAIAEATRFGHNQGEAVTPGLIQRLREESARCWDLVKEVEDQFEKWIACEALSDRADIESQQGPGCWTRRSSNGNCLSEFSGLLIGCRLGQLDTSELELSLIPLTMGQLDTSELELSLMLLTAGQLVTLELEMTLSLLTEEFRIPT